MSGNKNVKPTESDYRALLAFVWTAIVATMCFIGMYLVFSGSLSVEALVTFLSTPLTMEGLVLNWYFKAKEEV